MIWLFFLIIFPFQDWFVILFAKLCLNSYGTRVNQYCESNVTRGQGKQKMVREKSGNFMRGNCWTPWVNIGSGKGLLPSEATSHYLSQCWPRSMSPYGLTRPPWVNTRTQGISSHCIDLDPDSIQRCHLTISIGNPIVEIKRCYDHIISTMEFTIPVRWHLTKTAVTPVC